jgi:hypothetical protein
MRSTVAAPGVSPKKTGGLGSWGASPANRPGRLPIYDTLQVIVGKTQEPEAFVERGGGSTMTAAL